MLECIANVKIEKNGERTNYRCVSVFPVPGLDFNLELVHGAVAPAANGTYQVSGTLEERSGVKDGKPWRFLLVSGSAAVAKVSFEVAKVK